MMSEIQKIIKMELLYFFRNNQSVTDTLAGIAMRIGREITDIEDIMKNFIRQGLVKERDIDGMLVYYYNGPVDRKLQSKRIKKLEKEKIIEKAEGL
jgi:hypothetical protein